MEIPKDKGFGHTPRQGQQPHPHIAIFLQGPVRHGPVCVNFAQHGGNIPLHEQLGFGDFVSSGGIIILTKDPGEPALYWHQDWMQWNDPYCTSPWPQTMFVSYYLSDTSIENGCLKVIPGSHLDGIAQHGESDSTGNLLSVNQEIPDELVDKSRAAPIDLKAGQASIHNGQLYHASFPNTSQRRRCGLTVRFIPPAARQVESNSTGQQWLPILLRGTDDHHHYPETAVPFPS